MTERLYQSVAFGSIPVIVSDRFFQVGAPFQTIVPYLRFAIQLNEAAVHRNVASELLKVLDRLSARREQRMRELALAAQRDLLSMELSAQPCGRERAARGGACATQAVRSDSRML